MRAHAIAWCQHVAYLLPSGCHPMLLADRGCAATPRFRTLDALGWDEILRSHGRGEGPWYWMDSVARRSAEEIAGA